MPWACSVYGMLTRTSGPVGNMDSMPDLGELALRTALLSAYAGLRATGRVLGALQLLTR
jgi:hypothetical protein